MEYEPPLRVLVVDDESIVAKRWSSHLERAGFRTMTALDPEAAIEAAAHFRPHIALLDLGLPGMDGHELGKRLLAIDPSIALVAVTGDDTLRAGDRSEEIGFAAHLIKPVRLGDVSRMVRVVMTRLGEDRATAGDGEPEGG